MINTTLCYIEKDSKYLMLHRTKKKNDINKDHWIGVGGKFEADETPEECLLREVKEETGLTLTRYALRAVITFVSDEYETEYMYLFTATEFEGQMHECDEGELVWVEKSKVLELPTWEGDRLFLEKIMNDGTFFTLKVLYAGKKLVEWKMIEY